jgi:hypothetical protein
MTVSIGKSQHFGSRSSGNQLLRSTIAQCDCQSRTYEQMAPIVADGLVDILGIADADLGHDEITRPRNSKVVSDVAA